MYVYVLIFFIPLFRLSRYPSGPPKNRDFPGNVPGASTEQKGVENDPCEGWGVPPPIFDIFILFDLFPSSHFFVHVKFLKTRFSIFENRIFRFSLFHFFHGSPFSTSFVLASVATRTSQGTCSAVVVPTRSRRFATDPFHMRMPLRSLGMFTRNFPLPTFF